MKNRLNNVAASHNRLLYMQAFLEQIEKPVVPAAYEMYQIYWNATLEKIQPFPYVIDTMKMLKKEGIRIGCLSDLTAAIQYRKLEALGISEHIDYLVTSEEAGEEKPSEKMFDLILEKAGNIPEEVLMVGDSEMKDVEGARIAGMHAILYKNENRLDMGKRIMEYLRNV